MARLHRSTRCRLIGAALVTVASLTGALASGAVPAGGAPKPTPTRRAAAARCPWVAQSQKGQGTPASLAAEVLDRMTLSQKVSFVILQTKPPVENTNLGIRSLCIPPMTLTDGPDGIAFHMTGVTQLPAAIGVAATFDPSVARATGVVMGQEARSKGIDAAQGPELNLARVPEAGRIFEAFGEDPVLTGAMGVANVEGIQSTGTMANLKHVTAYSQETARYILDQIVPARALAELYNPPYTEVVQQGHVASIMCSYGSVNGLNDCSDPGVYADLASWGFTGFVRSDLGAVPVADTAQAFRAGIAMIKPGSAPALLALVRSGAIPVSDLDRAVTDVLTQMFRYGLIAHPVAGRPSADAITPAHTNVALTTAEASMVLLKNAGGVLPLGHRIRSVAVVGTGATDPIISGGGSSAVTAPFISTPLAALRTALGNSVAIHYAQGGLESTPLRSVTTGQLFARRYFDTGVPVLHADRVEAGKADLPVVESPNVTPAAATAVAPGTGSSWSSWSETITPRTGGIYRIGLQQVGDTWLTMNGAPVLSSPGLHTLTLLSAAVTLRAGEHYRFTIRWFAVDDRPSPAFGITDETGEFDAAVAAARRSSVAVVFTGEYQTEASDRGLSLPGDANQLIEAVAAVNPHTVVVINSGGAVLMPWLSKVSAVVEAWYPGEEDGAAAAAVLTGRVDPSGRLPITFPTSTAAQPAATTAEFPGIDAVVNYGTGLDVGYRWYQANGVTPLFPFGFGLDYTTFSLTDPRIVPSATGGYSVEVDDKNTGTRSGADVVQVYVAYPPGLGEPPEQLRAFARVSLAPGATRQVTLSLPTSGFTSDASGTPTVVAGRYVVGVGESSADLPFQMPVTVPGGGA
ncbi:MAG: glycoside hydrolase family 3 C-terminal domain-containing protein [Acidimicrobiales bacterium]|jgi:beta-glucosidase